MTDIGNTKGFIFNIQRYSIHDGPGIRTTVFLKGCPLQCLWCQNPESQSLGSVLFYNREQCRGCGHCLEICPERAIQVIDGKSQTDRHRCQGRGRCAEECPAEARTLVGKTVTAREVFDEVNQDALFYQNSGGGVTLSGGDPIAQPDFSIRILKLCREAGIQTAIETCGFAKWEVLKGILEYVDLVLIDFKHMDSARHREYTGAPNEVILENAKKIHHELHLPLLARVPVIPGYNDDLENMKKTAVFIAQELDRTIQVHLLPYHRLGETKYERMERTGGEVAIEPPGERQMEELKQLFESKGLSVQIGG
jgi:pyruvate formate lyase activating enzyme